MIYTPGIEVSSSAVIEGDAAVTHTVHTGGTTEIQFGGATGLYLCLSENALRVLNETTDPAIGGIDSFAA